MQSENQSARSKYLSRRAIKDLELIVRKLAKTNPEMARAILSSVKDIKEIERSL